MKIIRIATALFLAASVFAAAPAQEFSDTGVAHDTAGHVVTSKLYMSGAKLRADPQETGAAGQQTYTLLDLTQRTATAVDLGQKTYIQQSQAQARQSFQFFASGAPCPPSGPTCKDADAETVNGRQAEKWEIAQSFQGQSLLTRIWVDAKLHVWTKVEVMSGPKLVISNELQNIQEGPQPPTLFVIPAGRTEIALPSRGR